VDRDWAKIASLYATDGMVLPTNAPAVQGRPAIQQYFSGFPVVTSFRQELVEADGVGNLAYARSTSEFGKAVTIWRKQPDNSWLVIRGIWNSDAPPRR
jgi:ketosteroid isomerase-like protein